MPCPTGYHPTPTSALLGGLTQQISSEYQSCAPDERYDSFSPLAIAKAVGTVVFPLVTVPGILPGAVATVENTALDALDVSKAGRQQIKLGKDLAQTFLSSGVDIMGLFDDFGFDSIVDFASDIFDDTSFSDVLSVGWDIGQNFLPQAGGQVQTIPVMSKVPQIAGRAAGAAGAIAKVGPTVGRTFFNKFPNLAVAIQKMRNAGQNVSRSKLYSMLKRFGPEFLVSAGILTAAAVSELALAGPGHRRMNPANSKALRRSMRRIKSFHRLCSTADILKSRGRRRVGSSCGTCRKSPCRC